MNQKIPSNTPVNRAALLGRLPRNAFSRPSTLNNADNNVIIVVIITIIIIESSVIADSSSSVLLP